MCVFLVFVLKALKIYCLVFEWRRLNHHIKKRGKVYSEKYFVPTELLYL